MGGIFLFFLQNTLLFGGIFWLLTWLAEWLYVVKDQPAKSQFYECGFKAVSEINLHLNINFSLVCVFLLMYDIEFVLLYPLCFNLGFLTLAAALTALILLFIIIASLYYDIRRESAGLTF